MRSVYTEGMSTTFAYMNGQWVSASQLCVAVDDLGFMLGTTVTERLRTFQGRVFRLQEHVARLKGSLEIVGLLSQAIADEVAAAIPAFVQRNRSLLAPGDDWAIVAFATPGAARAARPTVCVHGFPLPFHHWAALFESGLPVVVSHHRQVPTNCWPAELKCRSRMHYYLADREAAARHPGARAIVLDQQGMLAEATTANLVLFHQQEGLLSPPLEHILAGVSLGVVQELAESLAIPFTMRPLRVEELDQADEAFLTSTSICALPIVECDGKPLGSGKPGPIYHRLLAAWSDLVGLDIADQARRFASPQARG